MTLDDDDEAVTGPQVADAVPAPDGPVGLVVAGASAWGAYEAGVLSVLLPVLEERGHRPTIFVGTSAGAINAVLFASLAHLPAAVAVDRALQVWRSVRRDMVLRPAWQTLPVTAGRYLARLAGFPVELRGLLDTAPLHRSLSSDSLIDWPQLHQNVRGGIVRTVAVVTTELETNRAKVFFESAEDEFPNPPPSDDERAIDYPPVTLTPEHVLASAAIPAAFPPVRLGSRVEGSWHMDGGVRLNTPLNPALTLGARGLVVVASDPPRYKLSRRNPAAGPAPSVQDAIDRVLHASLSENLIQDLWFLSHINGILAESGRESVTSSDGGSAGPRTYRQVPFVFSGPLVPDELGGKAAEILAEALQGVRALLKPDLALLNFLLGSGPRTRADLISYVFFEPEFLNAAIGLGQDHANVALQEHPSLWRYHL